MGYDWKQLERDENRRISQSSRPLGITWMVIGLVGAVVALLTGRPEKLAGLIVWLLLGAWLYLTSRRGAEGQNLPHDDDEPRVP